MLNNYVETGTVKQDKRLKLRNFAYQNNIWPKKILSMPGPQAACLRLFHHLWPNAQLYGIEKDSKIKYDISFNEYRCTVNKFVQMQTPGPYDFIWLDYCGDMPTYEADIDLALNNDTIVSRSKTTLLAFTFIKKESNYKNLQKFIEINGFNVLNKFCDSYVDTGKHVVAMQLYGFIIKGK